MNMILELALLVLGIYLFAKFGVLDSKARKKDQTLAEAYQTAEKEQIKNQKTS